MSSQHKPRTETSRTFRRIDYFHTDEETNTTCRFTRVFSQTFGFYLSGLKAQAVRKAVPFVAAAAISRNCLHGNGQPLLVRPLEEIKGEAFCKRKSFRLSFHILGQGEYYESPELPGFWLPLPFGKWFFVPRFSEDGMSDPKLYRRIINAVNKTWECKWKREYVPQTYKYPEGFPFKLPEELLH